MASQSPAIPDHSQERYLYAYIYMLKKTRKIYHWPGYFKNYQEAKNIVAFLETDPDIEIRSIVQCKEGLHWGNIYLPYTESEWNKKNNWNKYENGEQTVSENPH